MNYPVVRTLYINPDQSLNPKTKHYWEFRAKINASKLRRIQNCQYDPVTVSAILSERDNDTLAITMQSAQYLSMKVVTVREVAASV